MKKSKKVVESNSSLYSKDAKSSWSFNVQIKITVVEKIT